MGTIKNSLSIIKLLTKTVIEKYRNTNFFFNDYLEVKNSNLLSMRISDFNCSTKKYYNTTISNQSTEIDFNYFNNTVSRLDNQVIEFLEKNTMHTHKKLKNTISNKKVYILNKKNKVIHLYNYVICNKKIK